MFYPCGEPIQFTQAQIEPYYKLDAEGVKEGITFRGKPYTREYYSLYKDGDTSFKREIWKQLQAVCADMVENELKKKVEDYCNKHEDQLKQETGEK